VDRHQPVLTTAVYAENEIILDPIAVVLASEDISLMINHPLANIFPVAEPISSLDEQDDDEEDL
jgi:hypothetical protein